MRDLLRLQELDLKIEACKKREQEIPKQKEKFGTQKKRLAAEIEDREKGLRELTLEQRNLNVEIEQKQGQIGKYNQQLLGVKKNEEYQALLHEIELLKKQIAQKEERVIALMVDLDESRARLEEDKKRIDAEHAQIDRQCGEIDAELAEAVAERRRLEHARQPILQQIEPTLMAQYNRIRASKKTGPAVVPLRGEVCSGCHMKVTPQIVNEVLAGQKHACRHCGRLLYSKEENEVA